MSEPSLPVIDVRVPATLQRQWRGDPRLMPRPRRSDWIECRFASDADVEFAATPVEAAVRASRPVAAPQRR
jgi:hypothetical protein